MGGETRLEQITGPDVVRMEDAVAAVKRWFHDQMEWSLVVLNSADVIDDDESYPNLEFFPARCTDRGRHYRTQGRRR